MYYTIVNTKKGKHSHVYKEELTAAIMICKCAHRNVIPDEYPDWMRESIRRIQDDNRPTVICVETEGGNLGSGSLVTGQWENAPG